jgi:hypothetical protein
MCCLCKLRLELINALYQQQENKTHVPAKYFGTPDLHFRQVKPRIVTKIGRSRPRTPRVREPIDTL